MRKDLNLDLVKNTNLTTLILGFWFVDTVYTQALWKKVIGEAPSHFTENPQSPIKSICWLDTQIFLQRLNQHCFKLHAQLLSEAQ